MTLTAHPRLYISRGITEDSTPSGEQIRVLVYAPLASRATWVEGELSHKDVIVQIGYSVGQVVSALVEDPPPRPQVLVADFDDMAPGDLLHLHVLREQGWFGQIIALGTLPFELCSSLTIEHVIAPPLVRDALRSVVVNNRQFVGLTTKLPKL
jgi:hypothetical protein